jgi:hypothetical protein
VRTSQEIDKLSAALAKAQAKLVNPKRNRTVSTGKYSYSYATLDTIFDGIRPVLAEVEVTPSQGTKNTDGRWDLVTRLTHSSGQWQETDVPLPYSGHSDAQVLGSALSYAKRYGLTAALGIASEEDDDGSRTGKKPGKGSPAEGTADALDEPTRNRMTDIATVVQDFAAAGKLDKAKEEWESSDFRDNAEAKVFAWSLLPSGTRSAIKRLQANDRAQA